MPDDEKCLEEKLIGEWIDKEAFEDKVREIKSIMSYEEVDIDELREPGYYTFHDYIVFKNKKTSTLHFYEKKKDMYQEGMVLKL